MAAIFGRGSDGSGSARGARRQGARAGPALRRGCARSVPRRGSGLARGDGAKCRYRRIGECSGTQRCSAARIPGLHERGLQRSIDTLG